MGRDTKNAAREALAGPGGIEPGGNKPSGNKLDGIYPDESKSGGLETDEFEAGKVNIGEPGAGEFNAGYDSQPRAERVQSEWAQPGWKQLRLTDADRASIKYKAGRGLVRTLFAQAAMGVFAVLVSWVFAGWGAGASALIGAGAYFVPNALFAARLLLGLMGAKPASPFAFFMGELIKLGSAVALLGLAAYLGQEWLVWPALLFGLVCVLKGYALLLFFRKLP